MESDDIKQEVYEEGYYEIYGECYEGNNTDLYNIVDEAENYFSYDEYP